ncbi:mitochondrial import translocase, subunit Tom22 [Myriangium duriaei CBS 260.36]|uniref:Mitochondrial import translocase, subunit Tom22 n=1 Tax=Myriangium duriaei CBS 260.36 TaxID=1168546 RepID=A0A9P4JAY7_9PEZI|nr:mitochondrial import translocase, subunit Tom22 [Myriangium duriaei CBS 260.36]
MVKLEEVLDESFATSQPGPKEEDEWDTDSDTSSIASATLSDTDEDETFIERLSALKDIIPPTTRKSLSDTFDSATSWASWGLKKSGSAAWIVTTSVMLVGVPWALAFAEEQQMDMYEREMKAQESAGQMLTQDGKPAL